MLNKIKEDLLSSRKERNELKSSILRLILSEHELELNRGNKPSIENVIKKIIQSNNEVIEVSKDLPSPNLNLLDIVNKENVILRSYLPVYLTEQEVHNYLEQVELTDNFGKNMGILVKFFKTKNIAVEPSVLRSVLESRLLDS
jgi:uncharacterized protein YqeY